jgi:Predicted nucleotide-binding protein containing TIR-like domain/Methyltransferase domain
MISQRWGIGALLPGRGSDPDIKPTTVFVASTREAVNEGWLLSALGFAEERLQEQGVEAELLLWNDAFETGDMTPDKLINLSGTVGAAIIVLTADDDVHSRGTETSAPRDNLVFEAGLFLSNLGFERVLMLREEDSKLPSDLLGVHLTPFGRPAGEGMPSRVAIQNLGLQIYEFVAAALDSSQRGSDSSVNRAIMQSLDRVTRDVTEVRNAMRGRTRTKDPIEMPDAPMAYVDAVHEVKDTFLATTYLDSAFWTMKQLPVIEANQKLLKRLAATDGGTAKRLILLSQPVEDELKSQQSRRRSLRSVQPRSVEHMDKDFNAFSKANMNLVESGFDVRVVYDHEELWQQLPDGMHFSAGDTELAVFDEDRIDIYSGFAKSGLPAARVFGETTHREFKAIYDMTVTYMNDLWNSRYAQDFPTFAGALGGIVSESQFELDYEPNWLLKYDDDANEGDARLKREEMKFVVDVLGSQRQSREVSRHLDLGTCTGRYLSTLRSFVGATGTSVGVDLDIDCVQHCKRKHHKSPQDESRFRIMDADLRKEESLPKESFELVTCMMGTLCHLKRSTDGGRPYDDPWQTGLENLAARLAMDGDAFVAIWNVDDDGPGTSTPSLLSIYPQRSTDILLKQSPPKDEFEGRLEQAKLQPVSSDLLERRLHVYHLRHA